MYETGSDFTLATAIRTGERHTTWHLPTSPALRDLEDDAATYGLDLELAARLVVETALTARDLRGLGIELIALDEQAAGHLVDASIDASSSAYIRRLTTSPVRQAQPIQPLLTISLPARLSTRLADADLGQLLRGASLARARAWETAAVLEGRTISEWAPLAALRAA